MARNGSKGLPTTGKQQASNDQLWPEMVAKNKRPDSPGDRKGVLAIIRDAVQTIRILLTTVRKLRQQKLRRRLYCGYPTAITTVRKLRQQNCDDGYTLDTPRLYADLQDTP